MKVLIDVGVPSFSFMLVVVVVASSIMSITVSATKSLVSSSNNNNNNPLSSLYILAQRGQQNHHQQQQALMMPVVSSSSKKQQQLHPQLHYSRVLQFGNTDDDSICESILDTVYKTEYERQNQPCTCQRQSQSTTASGSFVVDCNYQYCEQCIEATDLCGYLIGTTVYIEPDTTTTNDVNTGIVLPTETKACVQYTTGLDTTACLTTTIDYSTYNATCTVTVGDAVCNSCTFDTCDSITGESGISFDCTNVNGLYQLSICDYEPYTTVPKPTVQSLDPIAFLRFDEYQWDTCYADDDDGNDNNNVPTATAPAPATTPVTAPTPTTLAPVAVTITAQPTLAAAVPTTVSPTASNEDDYDDDDTVGQIPTTGTTGDFACAKLLNQTYRSDYEREYNGCTCNYNIFGQYWDIDCTYQHCEECITNTDNNMCGYMTRSTRYIDEDPTNVFDGYLLTEETTCITYTSGRNDTMCLSRNYGTNSTNRDYYSNCQISLDDTQCTSCAYTKCSDDPNKEDYDIAMDCTNIPSIGYNASNCNYYPHTNELQELDPMDPNWILRFDPYVLWSSCYTRTDNNNNTDSDDDDDTESVPTPGPIALTPPSSVGTPTIDSSGSSTPTIRRSATVAPVMINPTTPTTTPTTSPVVVDGTVPTTTTPPSQTTSTDAPTSTSNDEPSTQQSPTSSSLSSFNAWYNPTLIGAIPFNSSKAMMLMIMTAASTIVIL